MTKIKNFEELESWKIAYQLGLSVYRLSLKPPIVQDYGLCNQVRRSSVSITSNIAEGFERNGDREFIQFLSIAKGSCGELRSQLYLLKDLEYINNEDFEVLQEMCIKTGKLLSGLMRYLAKSDPKGWKFKEL